MPDTTTSVLICGAGPVGLALAIELGLRGVDCLVVEKREAFQCRAGLQDRDCVRMSARGYQERSSGKPEQKASAPSSDSTPHCRPSTFRQCRRVISTSWSCRARGFWD